MKKENLKQGYKVIKIDDDILEVIIFIGSLFGLFIGVYLIFEYGI
ncbi:MAG: hypothetical protein ACRCWM_01235 [Sarcina sp.]